MAATGEAWRGAALGARFVDARTRLIPQTDVQDAVLLHVLRQRSRPVRSIVDLGAGGAALLARLLDAFPDARGVAVDYAPAMCAQAKDRLASFGPRVAVALADLRDSAWKTLVADDVDVVVSGFAIHHLPDDRKRALYGEIFAALVPGGTFLNLEHVASATPVICALFDEAMVAHQAGDGDVAAARAAYHARPDRADNILTPVETQCAWLRALGFVDVDVFWKWFELALFGGQKPCS